MPICHDQDPAASASILLAMANRHAAISPHLRFLLFTFFFKALRAGLRFCAFVPFM
jgi:hypothetical protein